MFTIGIYRGSSFNGESDIEFSFEDDTAELVHSAIDEGESFSDCEELSEIYQKVYEAAVDQITEDYLEFSPDEVEGEDWRADDPFDIVVEFV